jgi:arylsulfatase
MENLWDDPAASSIKRDMTERLVHTMMEHAEQSPRPTRTA